MPLYPNGEASFELASLEDRPLVTVEPARIKPLVDETTYDFVTQQEAEEQDDSNMSELSMEMTDSEANSITSPVKKKLVYNLPVVNFKDPLPLNVISPNKQAKAIGWTIQETRLANRLTGIFSQLPMVCKGTAGCVYGPICPVTNRDDFIGSSCPLELMEIFKHFVAYTRELAVSVEDHIDLLTIADMCRLQLQMWRTDMSMKLETEVIQEDVGQSPGSKIILKKKVININRAAQASIRNDLQKLYKQMLSTREDKLKKKATNADMADSLSVMLSSITNFSNKKAE
jgi:hypothetical protein